MKKIILALICAVVSAGAFAQGKLTVNAGFLFPSTLNATLGYEHSFTYGNAIEVFGEVGNHWRTTPGDFWKGYYWDGGILYKHRLVRYKNGMLRFRFILSSGRLRGNSFSAPKQGLNTTMCFRTDGSSR